MQPYGGWVLGAATNPGNDPKLRDNTSTYDRRSVFRHTRKHQSTPQKRDLFSKSKVLLQFAMARVALIAPQLNSGVK